MSEVSLFGAYRAYRTHALSNSLQDLYVSIVKGQAAYGYTVTHIYSFIDITGSVQLFYCRNGNHGDLLTSPFVSERALLWERGKTYPPPEYLQAAYSEFLRDEGIAEHEITALLATTEAVDIGITASANSSSSCPELNDNMERVAAHEITTSMSSPSSDRQSVPEVSVRYQPRVASQGHATPSSIRPRSWWQFWRRDT